MGSCEADNEMEMERGAGEGPGGGGGGGGGAALKEPQLDAASPFCYKMQPQNQPAIQELWRLLSFDRQGSAAHDHQRCRRDILTTPSP